MSGYAIDGRVWAVLARLADFVRIESEIDSKLLPLLAVPAPQLPDTTEFPNIRDVLIPNFLGHSVDFTFVVDPDGTISVSKATILWPSPPAACYI